MDKMKAEVQKLKSVIDGITEKIAQMEQEVKELEAEYGSQSNMPEKEWWIVENNREQIAILYQSIETINNIFQEWENWIK